MNVFTIFAHYLNFCVKNCVNLFYATSIKYGFITKKIQQI